MKISITDSDYVGSVTGICLKVPNHEITLMDNDARKVEQLNNGNALVFEPVLNDLLTEYRVDQ